MIKVSDKEVKQFLKILKKKVVDTEVSRKNSKHYKLYITTKNRSNEVIKLPPISLPLSKSTSRWEILKQNDVNRLFRRYDIDPIHV